MYPLGRFLAIALLAGGAAGCNPKPATAMDAQTIPSAANCQTDAEIMSFLQKVGAGLKGPTIVQLTEPELVNAFVKLWMEKTGKAIPGVDKPDKIEALVAEDSPTSMVIFLQDGKSCQPGPATIPLTQLRDLIAAVVSDAAPIAPEKKSEVTPAPVPLTPQNASPATDAKAPDKAAKAVLPNPFDGLKIAQGEKVPDLKCMKRAELVAQIKAHDGSELVKMTHDQFMFYKGFYAGLDFTSNSYPLGDSAVFSAHATTNKDGKAALEGLAAIEMGDTLVCNVTPLTETPMMDLFKAAGGHSGE